MAAFAVGGVLRNLPRLGGPHASEQSRPLPDGGHCSVPVSREAPRRHINAAACDTVCFGIDASGREKVCESVRQAHNGPHAPQQIVSPVLIARNTARVHSSPNQRAKALSTRRKLRSSRRPMGGPPCRGRWLKACRFESVRERAGHFPMRAQCPGGTKGASRNALVRRQTVTVGCPENSSACTTSAGRGFPKSPGAATVTISPRLSPMPPYAR